MTNQKQYRVRRVVRIEYMRTVWARSKQEAEDTAGDMGTIVGITMGSELTDSVIDRGWKAKVTGQEREA